MPRPLSALLVVLALAGCGGDDEDYRDRLRPIDGQLVRLADDVESALREAGGSDDAGLARQFATFARRLGRLRGRLADLEPPSNLTSDHDQLVEASEPVRAALARIAAAARSGDAVAARDAATELVRRGAELDRARAELARAAER